MAWEPFVYGGVAGMAAEAMTYPLDTSKTRLQLQGQTADASLSALRYRGMCHTLTTVVKEEGARALLRGVRFAFLRQATYGTLRLGVYYNAKEGWEKRHTEMSLIHLVALGSCVGAVGAFLTTPAEVLRVRAQVTTNQPTNLPDIRVPRYNQRSIWKGFIQVYRTEGLRGLYRGSIANAQRAAVLNGVEIPSYDACKIWLSGHGWAGDNMSTHLACSLCAGFMGSCFSQPIDVARTRMMFQKLGAGGSDVRLYRGVMDTIYQTVRYEGVTALWKGFIPTFCRLAPWNVVFFLTFEQLKQLGGRIMVTESQTAPNLLSN